MELGLRGIDCAVVEQRREPQRIPKGQNLTQRSMEHFYSWGIADKLRTARMGRNVFEELGKDFTLLAFDADDAMAAAFAQAAEVLHVPLKIVRDAYADGRKAYEAKLILVRPDRYAARASQEPADAAAILAKVAGHKS